VPTEGGFVNGTKEIKMNPRRMMILASTFLCIGVSAGAQPIGVEAVPGLRRQTVLSNLQAPWDLAFLSNGTMFFTEKCRGLSVRLPSGTVRRLFGTSGSAVVPSDFFCRGQSGMHGVAVDPDFANNRRIYVYMPSRRSNPATNRVVRLAVSEDFRRVSSRTDIVTDIPFKNVQNSHGAAGSHSGGRLRFGPDGFLYVTSGDNHNGTVPQDLQGLGGKVLRVTRAGAPALDNNSPAGADPRIFTYGHRNVQGITFRPQTGQPYVAEHGPGHTDEITPLVAGGNGGWDPAPNPGVVCADNYCGYGSNRTDGTPTRMTDLEKFPMAMRPAWTNGGASDGMGPAHFITGSRWQDWNGRLAVGMMAQGRLRILAIGSNGNVSGVSTANLPQARMRSLVQGPNGDLYIATDEGQIWRVSPL